MISSWNRQHTSIDSGALCAQFYTGGGGTIMSILIRLLVR